MRWKIISGVMVLFVLLIWKTSFHSQTQNNDAQVWKIGIPTGSAGLIIRYLADDSKSVGRVKAVIFSPYTLYDCCAAATQYAMGSGRLDAAIMCVDAAAALLKKDARYVLVGPVIANSDILVTRKGVVSQELSIAVSKDRAFQHKIIERHLGTRGCPVSMLHAGVPYAYGRGVVQGAVVDITQVQDMPGLIFPATGDGDPDMVTYVMVIKKTLKDKKRFRQFMDQYEKAVARMQDRESLLDLMQTYVSADMTMGDTDTWEKMNVRFMHPLDSHRQE